MTSSVQVQRLYESLTGNSGYRVFIDRLWPRGVAKGDFQFDQWCKELAPTSELRKWFHSDTGHWDEFCKRYRDELRTPEQQERMQSMLSDAGDKTIILLFGAKDTEHNQAVILAQEIERIRNS